MKMIREAADAASQVYETHWLKHWTKAHVARLGRVKTDWGFRMAIAGLFSDIETIMKDVPQNEHP
ncbi:hypothetical protein JQ617_08140 [Bradyrhizobium sp. KB893862 SZCCT0404]|uniref:hypothetical protein n=1 Tax=Bradyrhizobium sp. KB893862 SZCCT0404 TaxID=2807672 RepID=UPI001BACD62B|nr:hypothetical protein [Bradyrhizobium sp. KB893862 SZCCT0404]MBR1173920.1 hypothetical protein [Bradyrhizobium sp. KB893862 SZCCT0404]